MHDLETSAFNVLKDFKLRRIINNIEESERAMFERMSKHYDCSNY